MTIRKKENFSFNNPFFINIECSMTDPKCPNGYVEDKRGLCNKWERKIHCVKGIETECAMTAEPKCPKGYDRIKTIICNKWERKARCVKKN